MRDVPSCANLRINSIHRIFTLKVPSEVLIGGENIVAVDQKEYFLVIRLYRYQLIYLQQWSRQLAVFLCELIICFPLFFLTELYGSEFWNSLFSIKVTFE